MKKLNIRKDDTVLVISGKDKGKTGKVLSADPANEALKVDGVNIITKHVKARKQGEVGGIQKEPGNIHVSNVMIVCPACGERTRISYKVDETGKKIRVCKKCGASLDVEAKAAVKKETKATPEAEKKPAAKKTATKKTAKKAE